MIPNTCRSLLVLGVKALIQIGRPMTGQAKDPRLPDVPHIAVGPTYAHRFLDAVKKFTARPALRWKESGTWQEMSYSQLEHRVVQCAAGLHGRDVTKGDRVAIWLENSWQWIVCDLACQLLGAVTTTVYHTLVALQTADLLRDAEPAALLSNNLRLNSLFATDSNWNTGLLTLSIDNDGEGYGFEALLNEGSDAIDRDPELKSRFHTPQIEAADLSALFYTSGTTGEPKGAMLTQANVVFNAQRTIEQMLPVGVQTALLHLPLAHVMARNTTVPATLLSGGVLAIAEPEREKIPSNLVESAPTAFPTVPHLLDKFRERALHAIDEKRPVMRKLARLALRRCGVRRQAAIQAGGDVKTAKLGIVEQLLDRIVLSKLRDKLGGRMEFIVTGGANSNRQSIEFFWGIGVPVYEGYGATELTGTAAITWSRGFKLGTVGQAVPGVEIKLADDGEVLVRGPIVMKGYWRRPEATAAAIDQHGWYHTGDIGTLDAAGYLTIIDRKREIMVLTTGKNIAPQAVENALKRSPLVTNVCTIGDGRRYATALVVPDLAAACQRLGLSEPTTLDNPKVIELLRVELDSLMTDLADFQRIKRFTLITEPFTPDNQLVTPTLKLLRRRIAERFADDIEDLYAESPQRAIPI